MLARQDPQSLETIYWFTRVRRAPRLLRTCPSLLCSVMSAVKSTIQPGWVCHSPESWIYGWASGNFCRQPGCNMFLVKWCLGKPRIRIKFADGSVLISTLEPEDEKVWASGSLWKGIGPDSQTELADFAETASLDLVTWVFLWTSLTSWPAIRILYNFHLFVAAFWNRSLKARIQQENKHSLEPT